MRGRTLHVKKHSNENMLSPPGCRYPMCYGHLKMLPLDRCLYCVQKINQKIYTTFFTNSRTELAASTTSLNPITSAPNIGVRKPSAATGMATML